MKRNDAILRLALRDKNKIPTDDHQKIEGTNLQGEESDFDINDNPGTKKIYDDKPQCILARANQDFIADPEADKDITISNSVANNTEAIPSTSSIEVRDQSSQQIRNPIIDDSTDSSSDTESTSSSGSSSSTSNEDSDDSVKDPDFEIEQRRSIEMSDDSETKDNIGNQANFEVTSAAISSGPAVDVLPTLNSNPNDTLIPDTKKRSRKRVAEPTGWLQNKCKILRDVMTLYAYCVLKYEKLKSITRKFFVTRHTQNEGDSVHSVIEKCIKKSLKSGPIYVPSQYAQIIRTAKKTGPLYSVNELSYIDFISLKKLHAELRFGTGNMKLKDVGVVKFLKETPCVLYYKNSYDDEGFSESNIWRTHPEVLPGLKPAYVKQLSISERKKADLMSFINSNHIPRFYAPFYNQL